MICFCQISLSKKGHIRELRLNHVLYFIFPFQKYFDTISVSNFFIFFSLVSGSLYPSG